MRLGSVVMLCVLALTPAGCSLVGRAIIGGPGDGAADLDADDVFDANTVYDVACDSGQRAVNGTCVGEGSLEFTLTWDRPGDLDLHVVTPAGHEIYYGLRSADGGTLDVDDTMHTGPENVFWSSAPPPGNYIVCVVPFAISTPVNYVVTVRRNGAMVQQWTGLRMATSGNQPCTTTSMYLVGALPVM
jgi:hypothetical protein